MSIRTNLIPHNGIRIFTYVLLDDFVAHKDGSFYLDLPLLTWFGSKDRLVASGSFL
jgi:hypothetical protein